MTDPAEAPGFPFRSMTLFAVPAFSTEIPFLVNPSMATLSTNTFAADIILTPFMPVGPPDPAPLIDKPRRRTVLVVSGSPMLIMIPFVADARYPCSCGLSASCHRRKRDGKDKQTD